MSKLTSKNEGDSGIAALLIVTLPVVLLVAGCPGILGLKLTAPFPKREIETECDFSESSVKGSSLPFGDVVRRLVQNLRTGWTAALVAAASWSGLGSIAPQPGFHGYSKVPFSQGFPNEINAREPATHQMLCLIGLLTTSMCGGASHE